MSVRSDVVAAIAALVGAALPGAEVRGFTGDTAKPANIGAGGMVYGSPGEPGEPEMEMSPLRYIYTHAIPVEIAGGTGWTDAQLETAIGSVSTAILGDRTLGGRCIWLDATGAEIEDVDVDGARAFRTASFRILATYASPTPL